MKDRIKVGLFTHDGGAHVEHYLNALAATDECAEVVLADPDGRWHDGAQRVLGDKLSRVEVDYDRALRDDPPQMVLLSMEARHAPPVIDRALDASCHVLAEKPACVRAADFARLVEKADARGLHLMLALANRTNHEVAAARKLFASGCLGNLFGLEMHLIADQTRLTQTAYHAQWFADKDRAGGGHLIWLGIHWLDLAMHVTGSAITAVAGFTANVGGQPISTEDSAAAALRFDNGSLGTITSGYYLDRSYQSHLKIWGSTGWLQLEPMRDEPLTWYTTAGDGAGQVQTWPGRVQRREYTPFVGEAVRACANGTAPPINSADGLRALKTVFAVYESAATGRAVTV